MLKLDKKMLKKEKKDASFVIICQNWGKIGNTTQQLKILDEQPSLKGK